MKTKLFNTIALSFISLLILSCSNEKWTCKVTNNGKSMYSVNSKGEIGGAKKGCSCSEIRAFEYKIQGYVDEDAMKEDFGC